MAGVVVDMKMKSDDKNKALEAAIGQIEKAFGKGSVMKLGQRESAVDVQSISTGSLGLDIGLGIGGFRKAGLLKSTAQNHQAKQHWHFMLLPKRKKKVAPVPLLMLNMHLTHLMHANLALILMIC
jgi:hypothetical protein